MRISVFGLGYVGSVSAACLAVQRHHVIGVDVDQGKLATLRAGRAPVVEPELDQIVEAAVTSGSLVVSDDSRAAVHDSEVSFVSVGTPGHPNGSLDLGSVQHVCREIGEAIRDMDRYHVVVIRSTVLPGTVRNELIPLLEDASGRTAGAEFGVVMNPEFLRETTAVSDFRTPSVTVIGELDGRSGDAVASIYRDVDAPIVRVPIETAEMVKYANNAFHATKVSFANEIGRLAKTHGVDGREVMDILCQDTQLNISAAYLRPGYSFGGSCLPKDVRALAYRAKQQDVETPLLNALLPSNEIHTRSAIEAVEMSGRRRVCVLGLSFKGGTDDVRESPMVPLIETLVGRGYAVTVFDEDVRLSRLVGSNKSFIEESAPHIASLMSEDLEDSIAQSEVVLVGNGASAFKDVASRLRPDQLLIDLVGLEATETAGDYEGICW